MRLALVIANLGPGGAQKVAATMANHWAKQGWQVTLIALDEVGSPPYFPFAAEVRVRRLGVRGNSPTALHALVNNARRILDLRAALRESRPEVVISFLSATNVRTILATTALGVPVLVAERTDPERQMLGRVWRFLRARLYPLAFRIVAQTEAALGSLPASSRRRGVVLPNPLPLPERKADWDQPLIVAAGRLVALKGFDLLIEAFAACAARHPAWSLVIWGEGPERGRLEDLARRLGLADRIRLPGLTERPGAWVDPGGVFVLSSHYEGFPNALAEAMAAGMPVIATGCIGARAMVTSGADGLLVPTGDASALAAALDGLLVAPAERRRLGEAARRTAERRFSVESVMARWTELVGEAAGRADPPNAGRSPGDPISSCPEADARH